MVNQQTEIDGSDASRVTHRWSFGLSFLALYADNKSIDNGSGIRLNTRIDSRQIQFGLTRVF